MMTTDPMMMTIVALTLTTCHRIYLIIDPVILMVMLIAILIVIILLIAIYVLKKTVFVNLKTN